LNSNLEIDIVGWLQLIALRQLIGTRTTFKDIKILPPATHLLISKSGSQEKRYWRFEHRVQNDLNIREFADEVFEAMRLSTVQRAGLVQGGRVFLSGGLDSRLIAAVLPANSGMEALTFAHSTRRSLTDAKIAAEVARKLGLRHKIIQISTGEVSRSAEDAVLLTGGQSVLYEQVTLMQIYREIEWSSGFWLGGTAALMFGDPVVEMDYINPEKTEESTKKFFDLWMGRSTVDLVLPKLFRSDVIHEYLPKLYESYLESYSMLKGPTAAHRFTAWVMDCRLQGFHLINLTRNHPDVNSAYPHLGYRFIDCTLNFPAEWLYKKSFCKFMIYHCLPQLRGIVYANTGKLLTGNLEFPDAVAHSKLSWHSLVDYVPWRLRKYLGMVEEPYNFDYLLLKEDEAMFSETIDILHSSSSLRSILDIQSCMKFIREFRESHDQDSNYRNTRFMGGLASMAYTFKKLNL
jgi:Asparagine synthase